MSRQTHTLNTGWQFTWTAYSGQCPDLRTHRQLPDRPWYAATVPGNVQADLHTMGFVDDPFCSDNADHLRWCEEADFWFRRTIDPIDVRADHRAILHFDGIDCFATLWIDGRQIGQHANMFVPCAFDVTGYLRNDRPSEILLRLASPMQYIDVSQHDPVDHPPIQRARCRKSQMSFGWDIGPRLITTGLWRPVRLDVIDRGRILHAGARTVELIGDTASMEMTATIDWHAKPGTYTLIARCGPVTITRDIDLVGGENDIVVPFVLNDAELWWPRGHGRPHLYDLSMQLCDANNATIDATSGRFGVCTVKMLQEPRADGGMGLRFTVNGADYFAKGMNWTPSDAMFGRITDERTRSLVERAADANINMLRVWGGGYYEPDAFFQACDELGILIWQDFMFACSHYPQDDRYLANVRDEITKIVRSYRGHVSLAIWAGDNEIDLCCGPERGTFISRKVIPSILAQLDPHRPYLATSPFSREGIDPNDPRYGDCHLWRHTAPPDDPFFIQHSASFISEIGRIALPSQATIDRFMPKDRQWPVTSPLWRYHCTDTNRCGVYRNIDQVLTLPRNQHLPEARSLSELIAQTQTLQAEACRFWIEHYGADPQTWGLLLWNLCDCWPQVSDAIISYDLQPKPAYAAIRDAYARLTR